MSEVDTMNAATKVDESEIAMAAGDRARRRAIEDSMLRTLLGHELDGYLPSTRMLVGIAADDCAGWLFNYPVVSRDGLRSLLVVGRVLQGLGARRLARRVGRCWALTDDGRHEARLVAQEAKP